jgi:hypothetical protein
MRDVRRLSAGSDAFRSSAGPDSRPATEQQFKIAIPGR